MPEHLFLARLFLIGGGLMAIISLILWFVLPMSSMVPPYLGTAILALGYGAFCRWRDRFPGAGKS
jgi:uncharacterized membrane protein YqjE